MCVNMTWVTNKYTGQDVLVKCGECLSCQYERAQTYRSMIDTQYKPDMVQFFITLDYDNRFVPNIPLSLFPRLVDYKDSFELPVLRGYTDEVLFNLNVKKYKYEKLPLLQKFAKKHHGAAVGVLFYKDFQDFAKRLRTNIKRGLALDSAPELYIFAVGEYGEETTRPHFHALVDVSCDIASQFGRFVAASWPYSLRPPRRQCELVYGDPSQYLSTYLTSCIGLPAFFSNKEIRQHTLHSIHYGFNSTDFDFSTVVDAFWRHDLRLPVGVKDCLNPSAVGFPYSKRFLSRFFPYIKGYNRLDVNSLQRVFEKSSRLALYARELSYKWIDQDTVGNAIRVQYDLTDNKHLIENCWKRCEPYMERPVFAYISARIYALLASHQIIDNYRTIVKPIDNFTAYDNLSLDLFDISYRSICPTLDKLYYDLDCPRLLNVNRFPSRVSRTSMNAVRNVESRKIPKQNQAVRACLGLKF